MTLFRGTSPPKPPAHLSLEVSMPKINLMKIRRQRKRAVRNKVVKVTLLEAELMLLKSNNTYNSVAKLLRESGLSFVRKENIETSRYSKLDRDFILELIRIGNNLNQIAKVVNTHIARQEPFEAVKLLNLLIGIDETLNDLKESVQ